MAGEGAAKGIGPGMRSSCLLCSAVLSGTLVMAGTGPAWLWCAGAANMRASSGGGASGSAVELAQDINKTTLQERLAQQVQDRQSPTYSDPKVKRTGGL